MNYYNDNDPFVCQWTENLIAANLIPGGKVDCRPIQEIESEDLQGYTQCHFFNGISGWSYALQLAGWPIDRPVFTGSCPCQSFSLAGKKKGTQDERHLWPEFLRLIATRKPATIFGEQVASPLGRQWLAGVRSDLEKLGYDVGAADLCAAGTPAQGTGWFLCGDQLTSRRITIGAPHARQRLYWVAHTRSPGVRASGSGQSTGTPGEDQSSGYQRQRLRPDAGHGGPSLPGRLGDSRCPGDECLRRSGEASEAAGETQGAAQQRQWGRSTSGAAGSSGQLADSMQPGWATVWPISGDRSLTGSSGTSFWSHFHALPCRDGKARRVEPGTFPLAHGIPQRVGQLRAYGNSIIPQLAALFIQCFLEAEQDLFITRREE